MALSSELAYVAVIAHPWWNPLLIGPVLLCIRDDGNLCTPGVYHFLHFQRLAHRHEKNRYTRFSTKQSEEFNTASRNVKPGLIASGIVSAWTWAATLLQSSTVAYTYGGT